MIYTGNNSLNSFELGRKKKKKYSSYLNKKDEIIVQWNNRCRKKDHFMVANILSSDLKNSYVHFYLWGVVHET